MGAVFAVDAAAVVVVDSAADVVVDASAAVGAWQELLLPQPLDALGVAAANACPASGTANAPHRS